MPWHIRKRPNHPNQAKVYGEDPKGSSLAKLYRKPLSKKWLSVGQAEKQLIAVRIAYNKSKK